MISFLICLLVTAELIYQARQEIRRRPPGGLLGGRLTISVIGFGYVSENINELLGTT